MGNFLSWNSPAYDKQVLDLELAKAKLRQAKGSSSAAAQLLGTLDPFTGQTYMQPQAPAPGYQSLMAPQVMPDAAWQRANPGQRPANVQVPNYLDGAPLMGEPSQQMSGLMGGPEQFQQRQQQLRVQADPEYAMAMDRMGPLIANLPPDIQASIKVGGPKALETFSTEMSKKYADQQYPSEPDKLKFIKGLQSKIDEFGPGTPQAKPYEDALKAENIAVTNAEESARHNKATEANAEWIDTKDAMGNPILINKKTFEAKRPDGSQADATETVGPIAKMIANYDMAPLSSVAMLKPYGIAVMNEVAKQNPEYDAKFYNSAKSAKQSFASGKNGQGVRMANSGTSHLLTLEALGNALDNGDIKAANEIKNMISNQFGGVEISGYEAAAKVVGDEINKFISGGPGAQDDRAAYAKTLSAAKGTAARTAAINALKGLMVGQLHSYKRQYETETRSKDFGDKLEPEVADLLANPQYAPGTNPNRKMETPTAVPPDIQKLVDQFRTPPK